MSVKFSVTLCLNIIPIRKIEYPRTDIESASIMFFENIKLIKAQTEQTLKKLCSIKVRNAVSIKPIASNSVAITSDIVRTLTKFICLMFVIVKRMKNTIGTIYTTEILLNTTSLMKNENICVTTYNNIIEKLCFELKKSKLKIPHKIKIKIIPQLIKQTGI